MELHADQLAVALRAARLLRSGGRMVYRSLAHPWCIGCLQGPWQLGEMGAKLEKLTLWLEKLRLTD
jgi:hypothetical protein